MKKEKLMARSGAMCKWDGGVLAWTRGACAQPIQPDLRRASRPPHPEPSPAPTWPPLFNHAHKERREGMPKPKAVP